MDTHSSLALDGLVNDVAGTHDEVIRIVYTTLTEDLLEVLKLSGLPFDRFIRRVIYPQLDLEYVVYIEQHTGQQRMLVLSK